VEDATLAEVLGGIVDADPEIVALEATLRSRLSPDLVDLTMLDYRCRIVSVVAHTLETWRAAGRMPA
jgi:hypothetical protein